VLASLQPRNPLRRPETTGESPPHDELYSGTTCPFSQRCRFVLYEKGMDFQIIDVDLYNKPEDLAVMNPYNQVPVLVERDLILYESNIINEYIDDRFPHPQLMPADPVMRARARLFLFRFEKELFSHIEALEKGSQKQVDKARQHHPRRLTQIAPVFAKQKYMLGDEFSMLDVAIAPLLWRLDHYGISCPSRRAADEVRRAPVQPAGVHRRADALREGDAQVGAPMADPFHQALPAARHLRVVRGQRLHAVPRGEGGLDAGAAGVREERRDRAQHQPDATRKLTGWATSPRCGA
jgi:stringent starvation protein A